MITDPNGPVRYIQESTSVGPLWVAYDGRGVCLALLRGSESEFVERCLHELGSEVTRETAPPESVRSAIRATLDHGEKTVSFNLSGRTPFQRAVLECVAAIPRGEVRTYRDIALQVGHPGAARAVGEVMRTNPIPILIPCHRVVRSDGSLGRYTPEPALKRRLLVEEGAI